MWASLLLPCWPLKTNPYWLTIGSINIAGLANLYLCQVILKACILKNNQSRHDQRAGLWLTVSACGMCLAFGQCEALHVSITARWL